MQETVNRLLEEAASKHNVLPLTGRCNLACVFCSHRQNPPGTQAFTFPPLSLDRLRALIPRLRGDRKIIIGESATRLREGEPLTHPRFREALEAVRARFPDTPLQVTTNGSLLDRETVSFIASLKPLEVVLSLNSASLPGRRLLMGDARAETALAAPDDLARRSVPFHGSIVPQPHLSGWDDLRDTVRFLDACGALTVRLLLPGYTRLGGEPAPPGDLDRRCRALLEEEAATLAIPAVLEPPLVEDFTPQVEGVIRDTPAGRAGLRRGDRVASVDGAVPRTRVEAFTLARRCGPCSVEVIRDGKRLSVDLNKEPESSPGFILAYDLDPAQALRVRRKLKGGRRVLMAVSTAALGRWELARSLFGLEGLCLVPVLSRHFGGNISSAGLLTVSDFAAALLPRLLSPKPDLILLPAAAFGAAGHDLCGVSYRTLDTSGIPIALA